MIKDKTSMTPQVSECTKLAQSEYKERHEKVAGIVNDGLCHLSLPPLVRGMIIRHRVWWRQIK